LSETLRHVFKLSAEQVREIAGNLPRSKEPASRIRSSGVLKLPEKLGPLQPAHRKYLRERNFDPDKITSLWDVQGIGMDGGSLKWRLFIPFIYQDKTVSWVTRTISNSPNVLRYITASREQEAISHKELLYGIDYARHSIVVVEGVMDVWRIGPGAVAVLGTRVSDAQINQIARFPVRYICLDQGAERYSQQLVEELSHCDGKTYEIRLDSKDPDTASRKELKQLRKLLK
jgi:hypothetical protein